MASDIDPEMPPGPSDRGEGEPEAIDEVEDDYFADGDDSMLRRFPVCMLTLPLQLAISIYEMLCPSPKPEKFGESDNDRRQ